MDVTTTTSVQSDAGDPAVEFDLDTGRTGEPANVLEVSVDVVVGIVSLAVVLETELLKVLVPTVVVRAVFAFFSRSAQAPRLSSPPHGPKLVARAVPARKTV